ncbi:MAG: DUF2520 domain-containing protein [Bacteroidetes bacterium]|nr:MAG: DUF2520 domain-containing protein [Bacteroidota bacterium]
MSETKIILIGAGNVATNLTFAFQKVGIKNLHIHSRTEESAEQLAERLKCPYSFKFENIPENADLYIIAVKDDAVSELAENDILKQKIDNNLVIHTAGSIDVKILKSLSSNYGVFYPLQTFSKTKILDFRNIPICLEANSGFNYQKLNKFASEISNDVRNINSEQRKHIHLAAVFANNFTNKMFAFAEEILKEQNIDYNILLPLIEETFKKIQTVKPSKAQTGPAIRNDEKVMQMHIDLLKDKPDLQKIYSFVSENISESKK